MRTFPRHGMPARAALLALALVALLPATAAAHAELETSSPADGETVEGTPAVITADFTEALAEGSTLELLDAGGSVIAEGTIDTDDDERMRLDPPDLDPGAYEIRWQAIAEDGHVERGTYGFTVTAAATVPPVASAPPSAEPSDSVPPTDPTGPSPSASASPTPDPAAAASTSDVLVPIIVAVVLLALLAGYLLNRRRAVPPS